MTTTDPPPTAPSPVRMVALGSSFAAGPGIDPVDDPRAGRSQRNYPHLVAEETGAALTDVTVSGATTSTILSDPQRLRGRRLEPQVQAVGQDTDLVTVTAGGNDLGYLGAVIGAAVLERLGRRQPGRSIARRVRAARPLVPPSAQQLESATTGLVQIVTEVRRRAPGARILLVDYLPVVDRDTAPGPAVPFDADQIEHFRGVATSLSSVFADASRRSGAELVPASDYGSGHGVGTAEPWVRGLQPLRAVSSSFHPTAEGMQAVARRVVEHLRAPRQDAG